MLFRSDDKEYIDELKEIYDGMSKYEKSFMASSLVDRLNKASDRMNELVKDLIGDFMTAMDELPAKEDLTIEDKEKIDKVNEMYKGMSDFEKKLVSKEHKDKLTEYTEYMKELEAGEYRKNGEGILKEEAVMKIQNNQFLSIEQDRKSTRLNSSH